MPLIAMFFGWLLSFLPMIIAKVVLALGVGVVTYSGVNVIFTAIENKARSAFASGGELVGLVGLTGVDVAVNILLSAWAARIAISTVGGSITKLKLTNKNL